MRKWLHVIFIWNSCWFISLTPTELVQIIPNRLNDEFWSQKLRDKRIKWAVKESDFDQWRTVNTNLEDDFKTENRMSWSY